MAKDIFQLAHLGTDEATVRRQWGHLMPMAECCVAAGLTQHQAMVLLLRARGCGDSETARVLGIGRVTVRNTLRQAVTRIRAANPDGIRELAALPEPEGEAGEPHASTRSRAKGGHHVTVFR